MTGAAAQVGDDVRPEAVDLGPLTGSLGFLLRLSQLVSFEAFFAAMGPLGLRPGELSVLLVIRRNPGIRQGVVAQHLMIKRAHMAKMVRAMEEGGLLDRRVPEDDRRAMEMRLTPRGEALVARVETPFADYEDGPVAQLTRAEEAELKRLLRKYSGLGEAAG